MISTLYLHPGWSVAVRRRLASLLADMGEAYFLAEYPQLARILGEGPGHDLAPDCIGRLAVLNGAKSDHVWKPLLAGRMIRRVVQLYSYFGEGARDPRNTAARRQWFKTLDDLEDAQGSRDMRRVRELCAAVLKRVPVCYHDVGDPVPTVKEWERGENKKDGCGLGIKSRL